MTIETLLALTAFAAAATFTPGPNNLMLMASGANFGFRRTLPHMAGIGVGVAVMVAVAGLGLVRVFETWPLVRDVLKIACLVFLLWLAWRIAGAAAPGGGGGRGRPMTFLEAAAFQWVNPKAWAMALSAVTLYAPGREAGAAFLVAFVFWAVSLPSTSTWTMLGRSVRRRLSGPARLRALNRTMAGLLVLSALPML